MLCLNSEIARPDPQLSETTISETTLLYHKLSRPDNHNIPNYISTIIPRTRQYDINMTLRNARHHTLARTRTTTHQRSFFTLTGKQWNALPETTKQLPLSDFNKWIKKHYSASKPPTYYSHGSKNLNILHTRLRTNMTQLNSHLYKIQKTDSPACLCGFPQESTAHFIFSCPLYTRQRDEMIQNISRSLQSNFTLQPKTIQLEILLHGSGLDGVGGRAVARHFQKFIQDTHRFSCVF